MSRSNAGEPRKLGTHQGTTRRNLAISWFLIKNQVLIQALRKPLKPFVCVIVCSASGLPATASLSHYFFQ